MFLYCYLFYCCVVMLRHWGQIILKGRTARDNQTAWKELMLSNNVHLLLLCLIETLLACFLKPLQHTHTFLGYCTCRPGRGRYLHAAQWHDQWFRVIWEAEPSANQPFWWILIPPIHDFIFVPTLSHGGPRSVQGNLCASPWSKEGRGEGMLSQVGWAGVPSSGTKLWSDWVAAGALVGLVCIKQNQEVAVKGQDQKVADRGLPWSQCCPAELLCSASEFECHDKIKAKAGLY